MSKQQELTAEQLEIRKKMATGQLANNIYVALAVEGHHKDTPADDLVERAFSLAQAFDRKLQEFMEPPKIKLAKTMEEATE